MKTITLLGLAIAFLGLLFILAITPAPAQEGHGTHPTPDSHWYPLSCCSGKDCMPIPPEAVKLSQKGVTIVKTGQFLPWGDPKIRFTPPEDPNNGFHWCRRLRDTPATAWSPGYKKDDTICVYIPQGGA